LTKTDVRGAMIEAGSETTSMQLNNMLIGILSNPTVLPKAQEELDRVVGSERPPNFDDEPNLPYIRSIVKEVLRWRPLNKFGQNHFATQVFKYIIIVDFRTTGMAIISSPKALSS
jgi:cytochrome P450